MRHCHPTDFQMIENTFLNLSLSLPLHTLPYHCERSPPFDPGDSSAPFWNIFSSSWVPRIPWFDQQFRLNISPVNSMQVIFGPYMSLDLLNSSLQGQIMSNQDHADPWAFQHRARATGSLPLVLESFHPWSMGVSHQWHQQFRRALDCGWHMSTEQPHVFFF